MAGTFRVGYWPLFVDDSAVYQDCADVSAAGAGDEDFEGIEFGIEIGVGDAIPVDQDDVSALAGFEAAY